MAAVNVEVAHLKQWNFLQHSEEPAGRMKWEFETPALTDQIRCSMFFKSVVLEVEIM